MENNEAFRVTYAGFWFRVIAAMVDGILAYIVSLVVVLPLAFGLGASMAGSASMAEIEAAGSLLGFGLGILVQWLYFTVFESSAWQATPGKKMFGLLVADLEGDRIGFGRANGRYWSKIISALILMIGFLMVAFTKRKKGLHDIIAGTLVIRKY